MELKNLNKEDMELIKKAMLENSVTLTAEMLECKDVMPKESFERNRAEANRLVYLVNVLNGVDAYDR